MYILICTASPSISLDHNKKKRCFQRYFQIVQDRSDALEQTEQEFFEVPGASREKEIKHMCLACDRTAGFLAPENKTFFCRKWEISFSKKQSVQLLLLVLGRRENRRQFFKARGLKPTGISHGWFRVGIIRRCSGKFKMLGSRKMKGIVT